MANMAHAKGRSCLRALLQPLQVQLSAPFKTLLHNHSGNIEEEYAPPNMRKFVCVDVECRQQTFTWQPLPKLSRGSAWSCRAHTSELQILINTLQHTKANMYDLEVLF
jgi:hypothetical protein